MASNAKSTKGIQLKRGDGAGSESFNLIPEVTNFKGPGEKASAIDVTSFDSLAMENILGLTDNGEISFDVLFVGASAQQQGLRTDSRAGTLRNFQLNLNDHVSDPTIASFAATVTMPPELSGAVNQAVKASCSLKISGVVTWHYRPS